MKRIDSQLLQDYLERRLPPDVERDFEEAMIADPAIAELVHVEMAMRDGLRELAQREGADLVPSPATQHERDELAVQRESIERARRNASPAPPIVTVRAPQWLPWLAAAAMLALAIGMPMMRGTDAGDTGATAGGGSALTAYRVDADGTAAYLLPTSFDGADAKAPVRLRMPEAPRGIVLELTTDAGASAHRLLLRSAAHPGVSLALDQQRLPGSGAIGFALTAEQLAAGPFDAELERRSTDGWVREHAFVLSADGLDRAPPPRP